MARTFFRFLAALALAVAIEQVRIELCARWPAFGRGSLARAQGNLIPPGYDQNATGNYGPGRTAVGPGTMNPNFPVYGPSSPIPPTSPTRPASWPGGPQDPNRQYAPSPPAGPGGPAAPYDQAMRQPPAGAAPFVGPPVPAAPRRSPADPPYDPAALLARVGTEVIQANEVLPIVHQHIERMVKEHGDAFSQLPPDVKKEQLEQLERQTMKQVVEDSIKIKLLISEVRNKAPAEGLKKNEEKIRVEFNQTYINRLKTQYKAASYTDLEDKLRAYGSSLDAQRTMYVEQVLAYSWLQQQVKDQRPPTHEEMLTFYKDHLADWESPARARWEHLMVKFANFESKEAAYRALAQWGSEVWRGAPLAAVAKAHSQAASAEEGGLNDWTTQGSLRSETVDAALFALPEGALSPILEDEEGFHIVRVVQRDEHKRTPFSEVQPEIKKRLHTGDEQKIKLEYVDKLRNHTPVWTVFDENSSSLAARPAASPPR